MNTHHTGPPRRTYPQPLTDLAPAPTLFGAPPPPLTSRDTQFWNDVRTVTTRALYAVVCTWVPFTPGATHSRTQQLLSRGGAVAAFSVLLAEDLLPHLNLDHEQIEEHLIYIGKAFGLLTPNIHRTGPRLLAYTNDPLIGDCAHVVATAMDGQIPSESLSGWFALHGGPCPRCGTHALGLRPAQSRTTGGRDICTDCAYDEALRLDDTGGTPGPDEWPVTLRFPLPPVPPATGRGTT